MSSTNTFSPFPPRGGGTDIDNSFEVHPRSRRGHSQTVRQIQTQGHFHNSPCLLVVDLVGCHQMLACTSLGIEMMLSFQGRRVSILFSVI